MNGMEDSAKRATAIISEEIPTRYYGLQFLEGEMLALVGVSAGLKASLALSTCCWNLRDTLASPTLDDQLFGGLYAALAGVDNPSDAFLQRPPRHNLSKRYRPSKLPPPRSSAPDYHVPLRLRTIDRAPCPPNPPSPLHGETENRDTDDHNGIDSPTCSPLVGDCLSHLRSEGVRRVSTPPEAQQQGRNRRFENTECNTWKMRLKQDLAAGREPDDTFVFAGLSRGKQDVLLAVVPSTPPVIAITCTTGLSLFKLDGTCLPVVSVSPRHRWRWSGESADTSPIQDSEDDDEHEDDDERKSQVTAEPHERDIRCLAASPTGDMVATGSLDCTIRVRSVPKSDWVRRLRGHEAGLRCLAFHRTRLVSADSLGMIATWDIFPVSRMLCKVQGHSDSVQVLTWTSGGERLASGALDGSVVLWSISAEGTLVRVLTHGGLCHPYRLVAIGRCLAFTSSASQSTRVGLTHKTHDGNLVDSNEKRGGCSGGNGDGDGGADGFDGLTLPVLKGAHISIVDVDVEATSTTRERKERENTREGRRERGRRRVSTGKCLGSIMLSPTESWAEESDSSADEGEREDALLGGGRVAYRPPRLCRVVSAERVTSFEDFCAAQPKSGPCCEGGAGNGGGRSLETLQADWVKVEVSRWASSAEQQSERSQQHSRGDPAGKRDSKSSSSSNCNAYGEDLDVGAFCTCAVFVGRTLFLGYDTGFICAHRAYDGRRLYRLSMFGSVVHLVEAQGSLFAYASSGLVSRWSWGDQY
eukprot:g3807.t2